jgi:malonate-semialdehyde dehydrogenase (acetylating)/methylmalonate-semialdehyde dehydrogenase
MLSKLLNSRSMLSSLQQRGVKSVPLFVANEFKASSSSKVASAVINPATQEVLANTPQPSKQELDEVSRIAQEATEPWRNTPVTVRTRHVVRFGELVRKNQEELAKIVSQELGKTLDDARGSVFRGLEVVEHAYATPALIMGESIQTVSKGIDTYSFREPLGVCAGICPFNFPVMIPLWMFPMAAACGNTYILKPSEKVPLSSVRLMELALEAGFPPGVINMIHGGKETVDWICDDPNIKAISFVGGNQAGEYIYQRGTSNNKRVQSNMGAKNHGVILPDADKDDALNLAVSAAFGAAQQRCMALTSIVFVGEARRWIPDFVEKAKNFQPGRDFGPLVTKEAKERVGRIVQQAPSQGGQVLLDGTNFEMPGFESGNFVGPSVISGVRKGMDCYETEIFGPVAVCLEVDTIDDAIELINSNEYGNGVALFTQSGAMARKFQNEIKVGQVGINLPIPVPAAPFAFTGWNASMRGDVYFNGKQAVNFFTRIKTVTSRWKDPSEASSALSGSFPTLK